MKILKIKNLVQPNGKYEYKGLNIDLFRGETLIYFDDKENNLCYVKTLEENIPQHEDIIEVPEEEYNLKLKEKESVRQANEQQKKSAEQRLAEVEELVAGIIGGAI